MKKVYEGKKLTSKQRTRLRIEALEIANRVLPRTKNHELISLCQAVIGLFTPTDRRAYMQRYMAAYRKGAPKKKNAPAGRARSVKGPQPEPNGTDKGGQGEKTEQTAGFAPRTLQF
jgi:hypothetical protein